MKQKLIILPADSHIDLDLVFGFEKNWAFFKVHKREKYGAGDRWYRDSAKKRQRQLVRNRVKWRHRANHKGRRKQTDGRVTQRVSRTYRCKEVQTYKSPEYNQIPLKS